MTRHQGKIKACRNVIYRRILANSPFIRTGNFARISQNDIKYLFQLYDHYFWNGFFKKNHDYPVAFHLSRKMTRSAGKTEYNPRTRQFSLKISSILLFQSYRDTDRPIKVNGLICKNRLEALMRVMEHESVHIYEIIQFGNSSCKADRFKQLARQVYGHSDTHHQLVTQRERARKRFGFDIGSIVRFSIGKQQYSGKIVRITKRATIMVPNSQGNYQDVKGNRYMKCYVPLERLNREVNTK